MKRPLDLGIMEAFALRFKVSVQAIARIGTLQLCLCKSDEARRILLRAAK